ncbi:MAG TPA: hypothetical protein VHC69_34460 [Polyangiaceae bacterium]|nr:hypothetical protein [Polyangiaceae bacterium]
MSRARGAGANTILYFAALLVWGCSSGNSDPAGTGGAGGLVGAGGVGVAGVVGSGGVTSQGGALPQGGMTAQAGASAGGAAQGGSTSTPAGQLMCGGKLCHGGGHCAADGSCPAFLGSCFTSAMGFQTCDAYCSAQQFTCAAKSCNADGTAIANGVTYVSYSAANAADCQNSAYPDKSAFDDCLTPIGLTGSTGAGDLIRCCCKD